MGGKGVVEIPDCGGLSRTDGTTMEQRTHA